jgi:hypothetical protein
MNETYGGLPPIVRDALALLTLIEETVRRFPRYHKYAVGAEMRRQAMQAARLAHRAWFDRPRMAEHLDRLIWVVDDLKLKIGRASCRERVS